MTTDIVDRKSVDVQNKIRSIKAVDISYTVKVSAWPGAEMARSPRFWSLFLMYDVNKFS